MRPNLAKLSLIDTLDRDKLLTLQANAGTAPGGAGQEVSKPTESEPGRLLIWPLIVTASERQEPRHTASLTLSLTVNSPGPVIPSSELTRLVPGRLTADAPLIENLQAIDPDGVGIPTSYTYSIDPTAGQANQFLSAVSTNGKLSLITKTELSRDSLGSDKLLAPIVIKDPGNGAAFSSRSATSTIVVTLGDQKPPEPPRDSFAAVTVYVPLCRHQSLKKLISYTITSQACAVPILYPNPKFLSNIISVRLDK
ncbi:unnamed protein product [Protopolystoma xenopodis]|uniref:Cadherin domain-containing protein n=1 Tax=Protopolystoma xenopodis TaxID=117903 RepID=A0A448XDZ4_9PLAT|nr:unnamed protein product [Protopolystoma xenopodis]